MGNEWKASFSFNDTNWTGWNIRWDGTAQPCIFMQWSLLAAADTLIQFHVSIELYHKILLAKLPTMVQRNRSCHVCIGKGARPAECYGNGPNQTVFEVVMNRKKNKNSKNKNFVLDSVWNRVQTTELDIVSFYAIRRIVVVLCIVRSFWITNCVNIWILLV